MSHKPFTTPARKVARLFIAFLVCGVAMTNAARADTVVAFVSEASAPEFAAAADAFAALEPGHTLAFRSTSQLGAMGEAELRTLIAAADVLVLAAVYGDEASRIDAVLASALPATVVPLHGDARLTRHARWRGRAPFAGMAAQEAVDRLRRAVAAAAEQRAGKAPADPLSLLAQARRYRDGRGVANLAVMLRLLVVAPDARSQLPPPQAVDSLRFLDGRGSSQTSPVAGGRPYVALLDYAYGDQAGDRELHQALCRELEAKSLACVSVLARWGQASIDALESLAAKGNDDGTLVAVVVLQDFVLGGGAGAKRATDALARLGVPVLKGVRLKDRSAAAWRVAEDGLPDDSVHYRLAMPEIQGTGQPFVLAAAGPATAHATSGLRLRPLRPIAEEVTALAARLVRLRALRTKANADKRLAVVYYNHPPGRHNIGADNLDVPASLLSILRRLKAEGYQTGPLPADTEELLDMLQARGVNLPEDGPALAAMAGRAATYSSEQYAAYFAGLPEVARRTMLEGPLATLRVRVQQGMAEAERELSRGRVRRVLDDVEHLLEGAVHPLRAQALEQLTALRTAYAGWIDGTEGAQDRVAGLTDALRATGIEGLAGWGKAPGNIMVHDGDFVIPGLRFGNVFIGPQPPRGWELNEELLHANLAFPPPHQYLAFYEYLRSELRVDAVVHLGRHSTYEFLPGRRVGLGADDFSRIALGDLPSPYVYIVDGVGEGIQAKRRGHAMIVDHLTPSLQTTPLYDDLLSLRQLVESYEAAAAVEGHAGARALAEIRETIDRLNLRDELVASMRPELEARGIGFDEVDGELLVHEVGHYLTELQERFMPHGLHVFGQAWTDEAVTRMLRSMAGPDAKPDAEWEAALRASPEREARALLEALNGGFVRPGPGNDPVRTPEVLPTGRNFHALDASVLPTRLGYGLGAELAAKARAEAKGTPDGVEAVVLWASDAVRDEGAMVAFGMHMLGVAPTWNSRGIVTGLERVPLGADGVRRDVTFVASGLFRDLYGHLIQLLDRAVLVALEGAHDSIVQAHPELREALAATLAPLGEGRTRGNEPLAANQIAAHWVAATGELLAAGQPPAEAGPLAVARIFGDAPGSYGAGINRLAERSGAWQSREELSRTFVRRIGHAYGGGRAGTAAPAAFKRLLARTEHTYLGRASNLYGVLDNNDVFDYLGGLGMAVEAQSGAPPRARVVRHADPKNAGLQALPTALMQELRGRHLNPTYLKALMEHGYAGARTMGTGFVENLWGWQVTSPHIIKSWAWDEVKAVYLDDKHGIGLSEFLADGQNVHVRTNMQAVLLVAAHKGFWDADEKTLAELSESFARAVIEYGLPGSGHTRPDHPMMADVAARLAPEVAEAFADVLTQTLGAEAQAIASELQVQTDAQARNGAAPPVPWPWVLALAAAFLFAGMVYGSRRRT